MTSTLTLLLIALAAGVAVALQGQVMSAMSRSLGTATTMFVTYGTGGVISAFFWAFRRSTAAEATAVPSFGWSAGALGLVIVGGIGYAAPRLGLSRTLVITVAAQLGTAVLIEYLGLFGSPSRSLDTSKVCGIALTITGVWLVVK